MSTDEKTLREALERIHRVASGVSDEAYMSIPADPKRDADLLLAAAIDELVALRARVKDLEEWPCEGGCGRDLKAVDAQHHDKGDGSAPWFCCVCWNEALVKAHEALKESRRAHEDALAERDESSGEAAACIDFLRNLAEWHAFWEEGFLGKQVASQTKQNGQELRAFLDETNHGRRVVERLDAAIRERDEARAEVERLRAALKGLLEVADFRALVDQDDALAKFDAARAALEEP